jgi:hypothetical protein
MADRRLLKAAALPPVPNPHPYIKRPELLIKRIERKHSEAGECRHICQLPYNDLTITR